MAGWNFLGQGQAAWTADDEAAQILTECERSIWAKHTRLYNVMATATLSVAADANSVAVPAAVDGYRIRDLVFSTSGDDRAEEPIRQVTYEEWRRRTGGQHEYAKTKVPTGWCFSLDRANILFMQKMESAATFTVFHDAAPTEYVDTDLVSGSTKYSKIPDQHHNVLVYRVAHELAVILMKNELASIMQAKFMEADDELREALKDPGRFVRSIWNKEGKADSALADLSDPTLPYRESWRL